MTEYEKLKAFIYECILSNTDIEAYCDLSDLSDDLENEMEEEIDGYLEVVDQFDMYDKSIREKICQRWANSDEHNFRSLCDFWASSNDDIFTWAITIAYKDAIDELLLDIQTGGL